MSMHSLLLFCGIINHLTFIFKCFFNYFNCIEKKYKKKEELESIFFLHEKKKYKSYLIDLTHQKLGKWS